MKLIEIWKRLGKQPLRITQNKEAIVFINGEEYIISKIRYDSGKFIGFETKPKTRWFSEMIKPEEHKWVVVRDKDGREYTDHQWIGHAWYSFSGCDGWKTDIDVDSWRYQEE